MEMLKSFSPGEKDDSKKLANVTFEAIKDSFQSFQTLIKIIHQPQTNESPNAGIINDIFEKLELSTSKEEDPDEFVQKVLFPLLHSLGLSEIYSSNVTTTHMYIL